MAESGVFKHCAICDRHWPSRDAFLADPQIHYIGYQPHFKALTTGFFFFNHDCKATLALEVMLFRDLYDGPVFQTPKTGDKDCPGHCLQWTNTDACPNACECAFVRELIQRIDAWPKPAAAIGR